jgi:hypothetical protein
MVTGNLRIVRQTGVATLCAPENEDVVFVEDKPPALHRPFDNLNFHIV